MTNQEGVTSCLGTHYYWERWDWWGFCWRRVQPLPSITAPLAGTIRTVAACQADIITGLGGTIAREFANPIAITTMTTVPTTDRGTAAAITAAIIAE